MFQLCSQAKVSELWGASRENVHFGLGNGEGNWRTAETLPDKAAAHPRRHRPQAQQAAELLAQELY